MKCFLGYGSVVALTMMLFAACGGDKASGSTDKETVDSSCKVDQDCVGKIAATPCRVAACNAQTHACEAKAVADGTQCSTSNPCRVAETCTAGTCAGGSAKPADCGSKECGNDACGNRCGTCTGDEQCNTGTGMCEVDPTACGDITYEGCCTGSGQVKYCNNEVLETLDCPSNESDRKTCGWLEDSGGYDCSEQGAPSPDVSTYPYLCPRETSPNNPCNGRVCGFAAGQSCGGACGEGLACDAKGQCSDPCVDKECGEFGGKVCGKCDEGDACNSLGKCGPDVCGDLGFEGCCDGNMTFWCDDEIVESKDCESDGCGWVPFDEGEGAGDYYYCGGSGDDPSETLASDCSQYKFVKPGENPVEPAPEQAPEQAAEEAPEEGPEAPPEESAETSDTEQ